MLKIENFEVVGWEHAIRGMRNPMNSWNKSDSTTQRPVWCYEACQATHCDMMDGPNIGPNDLDLMTRLRNAGTDHRKFMRMITVYVDITAPLYWWKEFDTYKVGTVANSCSTMHKIHAKEFTIEDFSHEHLFTDGDVEVCVGDWIPQNVLLHMISVLNNQRKRYIETKDKKYWWQMIQLLPSSYNQKRTVMLNYEVLSNIYPSRRHHKLDEWHTLCDWIESLPYGDLIVEKEKQDV